MTTNLRIPSNLRITSQTSTDVTIEWDSPILGVEQYFNFRVYTSLDDTGVFTLFGTVAPETAVVTLPLTDIKFFVAISSLDITTNTESDKSVPIFVSISNTAESIGSAIAESDSGAPKFIHTDGEGNVLISTASTPNVRVHDGTGVSITSTSAALDVNVKSITGTNLPITIAAQTLAAIAVSKTTSVNAVANPLFVELSDGTAAFGVTGNPVFVNLKDGSGNALTSTSNKLDVGLTGANTVKLNDSAGTAITLSGSNLKTAIFDSAGDAAVVADAVALPGSRAVVMVGGSDGANIRLLATDSSGRIKTLTLDGSGNSITSTSSAMDVNIKTSSINVPVSIAAQTLTALQVSPTTAANTLANPFFTRLSDGANAATVQDGVASPASRGAVMVAGNDGSNIRILKVDSNGELQVAGGSSAPRFSTTGNVWQFATATTTATTADQTVVTYTVTAAKTFYLLYFEIVKAVSNNVDGAPIKLFADGVEFTRAVLPGGGTAVANFQNSFTAGYPIATGGQIVKLTVTPSGATSTVWAAKLVGFEL